VRVSGDPDVGSQSTDPRGTSDNELIGSLLCAGLTDGRLFGRLDGALARVDRVAERRPVVALIDGVVRFLERRRGGGEFIRGVSVGAARTSRINSCLRLIDFFLWRFGASGEKQRNHDDPAAHGAEYSSRMMYDEDCRTA